MKKNILFVGIIAAIIFLLGVFFKLFHFPGAAALMVLGVAIGIVYLVTFLLSSIGNFKKGLEKNTLAMGAITMIVVLLSFLFKILHWPGASVFVVFAHLMLIIFAFLAMFDALKESDAVKQTYKSLFSFTLFILMALLLFLGGYTGAFLFIK